MADDIHIWSINVCRDCETRVVGTGHFCTATRKWSYADGEHVEVVRQTDIEAIERQLAESDRAMRRAERSAAEQLATRLKIERRCSMWATKAQIAEQQLANSENATVVDLRATVEELQTENAKLRFDNDTWNLIIGAEAQIGWRKRCLDAEAELEPYRRNAAWFSDMLDLAAGRPVPDHDETEPRKDQEEVTVSPYIVIRPRQGVSAERLREWLETNFQVPLAADEGNFAEQVGHTIVGGNPLVNAHIEVERP
jgi:hypothetical protein